MPQKKRPAAYWMRRARWGIGPCGHSLLFVLRFGQRLLGPAGLVHAAKRNRWPFVDFSIDQFLNGRFDYFMREGVTVTRSFHLVHSYSNF